MKKSRLNGRMIWHEKFISALKQSYEKQRQKNPKFSMRTFAKHLGISAGAMSELMRGSPSWRLSTERAKEILDQLNLPEYQHNFILALMGERPTYKITPQKIKNFPVISDWAAQVILTFFDLPAKFRKKEGIAKRLNVSVSEVECCIEKLKKQRLLQEKEDGFQKAPDTDAIILEKTPQCFQKFHRKSLEFSLKALDHKLHERGDMTVYAFPADSRRMEMVREEIKIFHQKISALMNNDEQNDEIFYLCTSLFPVHFPHAEN